jgi:hypothetical protein
MAFSTNGLYYAKTAYEGFFLGTISFTPWEKIWKTWAPAKCHFFMWLAAHNRCWTTDVWRAVAFLTQSVVLCVTKHLRWSIISLLAAPLQENFGTISSHKWACNPFLLILQMLPFMISGRGSAVTIAVCFSQGINSLIILGAWTIWNQQNRCVFDKDTPDIAHSLSISSEEWKLWSVAGAKGISFLIAPTS